jgi:predicted transcriptional regulator
LTGTLTFGISSLEQSLGDFEAAWNGDYTGAVSRYDYLSYDALHKALAPNRMAILRAMMGQGPLSIREVARRVGRDFKGVHTDMTWMLSQGLLYKSEDGRMVFPYDAIRFDFTLTGPTQSAA